MPLLETSYMMLVVMLMMSMITFPQVYLEKNSTGSLMIHHGHDSNEKEDEGDIKP